MRGLPSFLNTDDFNLTLAKSVRTEESHIPADVLAWDGYKNLRETIIKKISEFEGVKIHEGNPSVTANDDYINVKIDGNMVASFDRRTTYFYCWNKVSSLLPKEEGVGKLCQENSIQVVPHTTLYTKKEDPATAIILGSGRSSVWALKHFLDTIFPVIKRRADKLPLHENEKSLVENSRVFEFQVCA